MNAKHRNNVHVSGRGPGTLFFAHGFGCDQSMWRLVEPVFRARFRTVRFDLVGFGASDLSAYDPDKYASLQGHADDVLEIVHMFGQGPCVFVGHSVSAMIGLLADLKAPGRLAAHAMVCPSPSFINEGGYQGGFERKDIEALLATMDSNYLAWAGTIAPALMGAPGQPTLAEELTASFCRTDAAIARQFARVAFLGDHRAALAGLRTPALVLQCSEDAFAPPAVGQYMGRVMANAQLTVIDNVGHCPHLSSPAATIEAIDAFLALHSLQAAGADQPAAAAVPAPAAAGPPDAAPAPAPPPASPPAQPPKPTQQSLLDEAACGLAETSDNGLFLRANATLCQWLGYAREDLVGRRKLPELLTPGSRIFYQSHSLPLLHLKGSVTELRVDVLRKDGGTLPMLINVHRHLRGGMAVHEVALFVAQDRDRYERELIDSRNRLQALVEHVTELEVQARERALFAEQMVGIVSHDLRNPVATILMSATLLEREAATERQADLLRRILKVGQRASRLINDLLDLTQARLGSGLPVAPAPIDLHATVAEAVQELLQAHPERKLRHVAQGPGGCTADADRLAQVVGNLVSNALAYGASGMPVVITSSTQPATFSIAVANQGEPIAPDTLRVLFNLMQRGAGAAPANHSIGLGLFIVSEIVRAHGGTVSVASTREAGTVFTAVFPRHGPPGQEPVPAPTPTPGAQDGLPDPTA